MAATIKIKNSSTASAVPTSSDLVQGELAVNVTDKRIFTENASGTVVELGTNPSILTLPDGSASAPTLTNDGDTNTGIFFPAADTVGITTGGTERMRLDASGNLGVGASTSNGRLTLKNPSAGSEQVLLAIQAASSTSAIGRITYDQTVDTLRFTNMSSYSGATTRFGNNGLDQVTLDLSGNMGLGVTPSAWGTYKAFQLNSAGYSMMGGTSGAIFGALGVNYYFDGTNYKYINASYATQYNQSAGAHTWSTAGIGSAGANITFTQAMTLDASGNLGVGTTSPVGRLHTAVADGATNALYAERTGASPVQFTVNFANQLSNLVSSSAMTFSANGSERARIDSSGNLLVGTTSGTGNGERVFISASNGSFATRIYNYLGTTPSGFLMYYPNVAPNGTGSPFFTGADNSVTRAEFRSNGGLANYSANNVNLSDRREKTNFAPAKSYLDVICAIPVQTYNYIDQNLEEDDGLTLGVVAQDVQAVAPELVAESDWSSEKDGSKMRLSIYQTDMQYALMKSIQELKAIVDAQAARITALEQA